MRRHGKIILACLLGLLLGTSGAFAQQEPEYKEGELLIKFKSAVSSQNVSISHARLGSEVKKHFRRSGVQFVKLRPGLTTKEAVELYRQDPHVEYAEPNYKLYALDLFPNDPGFNDLWGLHNTGQTGGSPDADINAPEAWQIATGSDEVIVAVIDTGVDYSHEDLLGNMWVNPGEIAGNGIDDDGNGYVDDMYGIDAYNDDTDPMDDHGHGTHCSGTIGAVGNNGIGVVGVNWNVKIMALKFLGGDGIGWTDDAVECLEYAILMKEGCNIRITSNSWGGGGYSQSLYDAILAAAEADILFVAAAGNDSKDNDTSADYPSGYDLPNIIAVAATDHNDALASFSNWGLTTVDVAAPGVDIYSSFLPFCYLSDTCHDSDGDGYGYCSGTSMATPHVSGLAALIVSQHPTYTWGQAKWNILTTVDPLGSLSGLVLTGGRINANSALACSPDHLYLLVSSPLADFGILGNTQTVIRASAGTCQGPVENATVTVDFDNTEPSMTLHDDGVEPDITADDGEYAAYWTPQVSGDVTLTITASASGYDPVSEQVSGTVAFLVADFSAEPTSGDAALTVQFTNLSDGDPGIESWLWNFGDWCTSTEENPSHTYYDEGTYTVSLTITYKTVELTTEKIDYISVSLPPLPEITSITPDKAWNGSATTVTIAGHNLLPDPYVSIYGGGPYIMGSCDASDARGVYVSGGHAYVAGGDAGLQVIDITDQANPTIVGECDTDGYASGVYVSGGYAYVADDDSGLQVINVSDPVNPTMAGSCDTAGIARDVYVSGNYAFIADDSAGLQVIDVSDPAAPNIEGTCGLPGDAHGVHVSGDYAYVADYTYDGGYYSGLHIIDISDPSSPSVAGSCSITSGSARGVYISGDYAYLAAFGSGIHVIDISNPSNPYKVGQCDTGAAFDVFVSGGYAYVAGSGIQIIDISDPGNPFQVGSCDTPTSALDVFVSADCAYVPAYTSGLHLIDVGGHVNPSLVGSCDTPASALDVCVSGDFAYVADYTSGLQVIDISDPINPSIAGSCNTPYWAYDVYVSGNHAYVADSGSGLQVIDISSPANPYIVGSYDTPGHARGVHVSGNYAYVVDRSYYQARYSGLHVINISNPGNPYLVSSCDLSGFPNDVFVSGDYAYVAGGDEGLRVVDISNPAQPFLVSSCDTPGHANDVVVSGTYAYVADEVYADVGAGLQVIDVSDPASPCIRRSCDTPGSALGVHISGTYLYVADGNSGFLVVDITDPSNPAIIVGLCHTSGYARSVCVSGDHAYVTGSNSGLWVVKGFVPFADVTWLSDSEITATVPAGFLPGTYNLHLTNSDSRRITQYNVFTVTEGNVPIIDKIRGVKEPGKIIRIIGSGFGEPQGDSEVHIGPKVYGPGHKKIRLWTDTKIKVKLPNYKCQWFKGNDYRRRKIWVMVGGEDGVSSNVKKIKVFKPDTCP